MKKIILSLSLLLPFVSFAEPLRDIDSVSRRAVAIGNLVVELTIALAVVWIIVNIFRYFVAQGEEGRKEGGMAVLYGVIGLFLILSVWGLVYLLLNSFRFSENYRPEREIRQIRIPDPITHVVR